MDKVGHLARGLDTYLGKLDHLAGGSTLRAGEDKLLAPRPLCGILTGTAGTSKILANKSTGRAVCAEKLLLLAASRCVACVIGGQTVHSGVKVIVRPGRGSSANCS